jgi:hypothetical protein
MQQSKDITGMDEENYKGQPAVPPNQRKISRSYFTKKLERKLAEDEVEIPRSLFVLMDTPFDDFSEAEREDYENRFRALTHVFVDALREVYISMGNPSQGWDEMAERLQPTPMKVLAKLVEVEEDRLQVMADEALARAEEATSMDRPPLKKRDTPIPDDRKDHWWDKKIF